MRVIDYILSPGSAWGANAVKKGGDDRYVFDEAAGWACVIDGATDVGPVRIFPSAESDAAHFAELFASTLMADPPRESDTAQVYLKRIAAALRPAIDRDARTPLKDTPRSSWPTAAATWIRWRNGKLEGATLGDTLAILRRPDGSVSVIGDGGKPADESARARQIMERTPEQRKQWLAETRAIHNTERGYWVFGAEPEAAAKIVHQVEPCPPGTKVVLMTDGFYRLVSPYGRYDDRGLIERVLDKGLGAVMAELRGMEANPEDDAKIGRFKTSDDATALLLEF